MAIDHYCAYNHDGLRCPRLGIFCESAHPNPKSTKWWCNYHIGLGNRGHDYADKQRLLAIMDDVREGRMPRGSSAVRRSTDALLEQELARLDLSRARGESRDAFVQRCRAKRKPMNLRMDRSRADREMARALLELGEDPDVAREDVPDERDMIPW